MGLFYTTNTSAPESILPLFRPRWIKPGKTISSGDEADQIAQETKWHQAWSEIVRSKNFAAEIASTTWEIKSSIDRYEALAALISLFAFALAQAEVRAWLKRN
jgi:hypothetical protein